MKPFTPLSDVTVRTFSNDNSRSANITKDVVNALPSYAQTMALRPTVAAKPTGTYKHNPYSANVLREFLYSKQDVSAPGSLDVSRDSVSSNTSTTPSVIIVKTPIRRVYRNGRPVPESMMEMN